MNAQAQPPAPLFTGVTQLAIASKHPEQLAAFYCEVLGLKRLFETGGMIFIDAGSLRLMIGAKQPGQEIGGDTTVYLEPTVWSATEKALEAGGVSFLHPAVSLMKAEGRELALRAFKDPEGHTLALFGWRAA